MDVNKIKRALLIFCLVSLASVNQAYADCNDKRAPGVDWSGCKKTHKMLDDTNFSGSQFDDANLEYSSLDESNFNGASLVKTDLTRTTATRAQFYKSNLSQVRVGSSRFHRGAPDERQFRIFQSLESKVSGRSIR
jgi:uncharacterized protein YjbI with pentapeptide repeats